MSEETPLDIDTAVDAVPQGIGAQLRAAREAKGLTREQIAAETRISSRHIEHIEDGNFAELPGRTYAVGFSRTMAKAVGLDQNEVVAAVRAELDADGIGVSRTAAAGTTFEPGDPSRAPGSNLVWFSAFAVLLLLVGLFFAARVLFSPAAELPSLLADDDEAAVVADGAQAQGDAQAAAPDASGAVVVTAEGEAWVRFSAAQGRVLSEQILQEGESYTIPADAEAPTITTARPDLLAITIGGQSVPKLSEVMLTLEAEPISAEALLARDAAPSEAAPATN